MYCQSQNVVGFLSIKCHSKRHGLSRVVDLKSCLNFIYLGIYTYGESLFYRCRFLHKTEGTKNTDRFQLGYISTSAFDLLIQTTSYWRHSDVTLTPVLTFDKTYVMLFKKIYVNTTSNTTMTVEAFALKSKEGGVCPFLTLLSFSMINTIHHIRPGAILMTHLRETWSNWHWITKMPWNITQFKNYGRLQIQFRISLCKLFSNNRNTETRGT